MWSQSPPLGSILIKFNPFHNHIHFNIVITSTNESHNVYVGLRYDTCMLLVLPMSLSLEDPTNTSVKTENIMKLLAMQFPPSWYHFLPVMPRKEQRLMADVLCCRLVPRRCSCCAQLAPDCITDTWRKLRTTTLSWVRARALSRG